LDGSNAADDPQCGAVSSPAQVEPGSDAEDLERIRSLPKEVGALLIVAGIGGLLFPGPIGTPFLIVGGIVLWPKVFERVEIRFRNRFPKLHRQSMRQIKRFLADLEQRYPVKG
jgi:hypothetical protein